MIDLIKNRLPQSQSLFMPLSTLRVLFCSLVMVFFVTSSLKAQDSLAEIENWPRYATVKLESDLSHLSENQRKMIPLLIEAG